MSSTRISLGSSVVENLEPGEETQESSAWISPFAVPQWAEVDSAGPGLVRSIRFHYLGGEQIGDAGIREPLDQRTDPEVELVFTDPTGKVQQVDCKTAADPRALERVADRLTARATGDKLLGRRFSLLLIARILKSWADGMQLWQCGGIEVNPRIRHAGRCRVVVIEVESQRRVFDKTYPGTMENPQTLLAGQVEVTWAEGGSMRIIVAEEGSGDTQRCRWSQKSTAWQEGSCPPDRVIEAILNAMR
jgi:hypothetical protein